MPDDYPTRSDGRRRDGRGCRGEYASASEVIREALRDWRAKPSLSMVGRTDDSASGDGHAPASQPTRRYTQDRSPPSCRVRCVLARMPMSTSRPMVATTHGLDLPSGRAIGPRDGQHVPSRPACRARIASTAVSLTPTSEGVNPDSWSIAIRMCSPSRPIGWKETQSTDQANQTLPISPASVGHQLIFGEDRRLAQHVPLEEVQSLRAPVLDANLVELAAGPWHDDDHDSDHSTS